MLKAARAAGREAPAPVLAVHDVWPLSQPYYRAWQVLDEGRRWSAGAAGVIPMGLDYSEMERYARAHGLAPTVADLETFEELMRALDQVWLTWHGRQQAAASRRRPVSGQG